MYIGWFGLGSSVQAVDQSGKMWYTDLNSSLIQSISLSIMRLFYEVLRKVYFFQRSKFFSSKGANANLARAFVALSLLFVCNVAAFYPVAALAQSRSGLVAASSRQIRFGAGSLVDTGAQKRVRQFPASEGLDIFKKQWSFRFKEFEINDSVITMSLPHKPLEISKQPRMTLSIPAISLENRVLGQASVTQMPDLDKKLLSGPVFDTLTTQPCQKSGHTYLLGHSEPTTPALSYLPGVHVFKDLHRLKAGDEIKLQNMYEQTCTYRVTHHKVIQTDLNQGVSLDVFEELYFPKNSSEATLAIQTCVKGSSTKRLIIFASIE